MDLKVFWFALAYCIISNFYSVVGTLFATELLGLKDKLSREMKKIYLEEQAAKKYVPSHKFLKVWENYEVKELISENLPDFSKKVINEEVNPEDIQFYLYTRENRQGNKFTIGTINEINIKKREGVKVVCHGWRGNAMSKINEELTDAYLDTADLNVIAVDWETEAMTIIYPVSARMTEPVGKIIAHVIDTIAMTFGIPHKDFHFIGHSLGAHVGGFVGSKTKKLLGRITGLDPALPGFEYVEIAGGRLSKENAHFVDVIHTCVHVLGITIPLGHVDFYPNGGSPFQPGCPHLIVPDTVSCSHIRVVELFANSIRNESNFVAIKCEDWDQYERGKCPQEYTLMGERVDRKASGIYYLQTGDKAPFHLGIAGTIHRDTKVFK